MYATVYRIITNGMRRSVIFLIRAFSYSMMSLPLRGRTELTQQVTHLRVGLVAVGDDSSFLLVVEVAGQSLTVLYAVSTRVNCLFEQCRGGEPGTKGILKGLETVGIDVKTGLVRDGKRAEEAQAEAESGANEGVNVLHCCHTFLDD